MVYTTIEELYKIYLAHPVLIKDTRLIEDSCIFIAIKGDNFDANEFASEAIEKGAAYALIDNPSKKLDERYLLVENTLVALQELAKYHRAKLTIPVIGITGSNGKTTTKELIYSVLSQKMKAFATRGNYNNHIGVPLSILEINDTHEIAIIEMGASAQGEIDFLCTISDPDCGLITNIGKAHLEGFGGIEGVKSGKSELYRHLEKKGGLIFLNGDDDTLKQLINTERFLTYGKLPNLYCSGKLEQTHPTIIGTWKCKGESGKIDSALYGEYNFYNMLAAVCIGNHFELTATQINHGINTYQAKNNRSELIEYKGAKVYLDAYNANPSSMEFSIQNFSKNKNHKKMVILGDMFEVGETSFEEHKLLMESVIRLGFISCVFVGQNFYKHQVTKKDVYFFKSTEEAKVWFQNQGLNNFEVLIKGSRGMALEKLLK
ncbi:MAG: UDP-N-acetylmuramoyl-tripeptide--D-alanyl-D-alanine ligase [Bacteroidetes bacterium]|nr:MAG: UDP-N-acetylmuramoyl-tripeptide--D-alanyl-D-alanine ligase [Bacteroidota bacterium]MBL1144054.1 UDP-N-acetylmuramoyl-tripeptide--D-alanyl-D-alanine ligase [Bacteroidota bacterium]NOG56854.1 UDP-N-acetylmuramoyl-tripeptide--D-alanyl-D-alanine ligase [Bacteroidota bacterium]